MITPLAAKSSDEAGSIVAILRALWWATKGQTFPTDDAR
ncbi:hypothetical protein ALQ37_01708 [Pseudomonas syringae pv. aptata]|uniref:Uncharacterized protein n=1 Tax=Pseudomonas syringae pv. aptata TaxID=83167 RepID=A0A3M3XSH6_PSEAP|nr:hypothetical protein ALQ37_01708 [Pseudomonas syringae pv. aptata]